MDRGPGEVDMVSAGRAAEVQEVWAQDPAGRVSEVQEVWAQDSAGRVSEVQEVLVQDPADRASEVQEAWAQDPADRASEVQEVLAQDPADRPARVQVSDQDRAAAQAWAQVLDRDPADPVADQAAVGKRQARGSDLAVVAARLLFREWLPASQEEPLAGAASRRKKNFSGFLER